MASSLTLLPMLLAGRNRHSQRHASGLIAGSRALEERAQMKARAVRAAVTEALVERGIPASSARLAAQVGMAALEHAVMSWFESGDEALEPHVIKAFEEVRGLSSAVRKPTRARKRRT